MFKFNAVKATVLCRCNLLVSAAGDLGERLTFALYVLLENLPKQTSFMLLEEFNEFTLGGNPIAHKKQQIGDSTLFVHLWKMKGNL